MRSGWCWRVSLSEEVTDQTQRSEDKTSNRSFRTTVDSTSRVVRTSRRLTVRARPRITARASGLRCGDIRNEASSWSTDYGRWSLSRVVSRVIRCLDIGTLESFSEAGGDCLYLELTRVDHYSFILVHQQLRSECERRNKDDSPMGRI